MKPTDFHIGLEFMEGPFWWRCTDVGTRSIAAIKLVEDDPLWYAGPPYMIEEVVLDEARLADCHLTDDEQIKAALVEADTSGHPGYSQEAIRRMTKARPKSIAYPRKGLFRFDRVWNDGEILHPYAASKVDEKWIISFIYRSPKAGMRCQRRSSLPCRSPRFSTSRNVQGDQPIHAEFEVDPNVYCPPQC